MTQRTAFVNGLVWTAGYARPRALDVLIEDERIVAVAARGQLDVTGADVQNIAGRLLLPAFQDAHAHLAIGGSDLETCDLSGARSAEEACATIRAYADAHPELEWVIGGGWVRELFPYPEGPSRELLDELVGGRAAAFSPYDRHGMWVSTAALERAGVSAETPDPDGGFFRRDETGRPTGMVEESAMETLRAVMPATTRTDQVRQTLLAQDALLPLGIASVQDALVGNGLGMVDPHSAYCELLGGESLKLRMTTALWWDPERGPEQIPELIARRDALAATAGPDRIQPDTVKIMVDGSDVLFMDAPALRAACIALDAEGFAMHFHSYGDGSTTWILDGIEAAIAANGERPRRHHIAHLFVVAEHDFTRFGRLGVTVNVQGFWAGSDVPHDHIHQTNQIEHPEHFEYPFGRIHAAGARLAAGSDWPVTTADPLDAIRVAAGVLRDPGSQNPIPQYDVLDPIAMLEAFTAGSAWVNGRATSTGRITPGFLADLVILDRNLLESDEALLSAVVDETWIGGVREYRRQAE